MEYKRGSLISAQRLLHFLRTVCAAIGFIAHRTAELSAQFFAACAIEAGIARVAFKALRVGVPVQGVFKVQARVAGRAAGGKAQAAAHGFVHFQAEGFVRAAVVEVGADFGSDAVMLAEVADGAAAIVRLQGRAVARREWLANVQVGFGHTAVVADGAKGLV